MFIAVPDLTIPIDITAGLVALIFLEIIVYIAKHKDDPTIMGSLEPSGYAACPPFPVIYI